MHHNSTPSEQAIDRRIRVCDYLVVAQLFLQSNFLLKRPLNASDIKPRLLGHWGTCHGINVVYANLKAYFRNNRGFSFILGPGHGYPALQANLYLDGDLRQVDSRATADEQGLAYVCRNFSWPYGFPSHASPLTPGVICEGGELGYSLGAAYGYVLGHPERMTAVLIGDGEFETATTLGTLNLNMILSTSANGDVLPILHLNGYKISGPTIAARKSERELNEMLRGFGYTPVHIYKDADFIDALKQVSQIFFDRAKYFNLIRTRVIAKNNNSLTSSITRGTSEDQNPAPSDGQHKLKLPSPPFLIYHSAKGTGGPELVDGKKIAGNFLAHQIPLKNVKTDLRQLKMLEEWLHSYRFSELFDAEKGFKL